MDHVSLHGPKRLGYNVLQWAFLNMLLRCESALILKSLSVLMFIETHKRESGIPSNRGSRHGEFVNRSVHTARTL